MKLEISKRWSMTMAELENGQEVGAGSLACFCVGPQNGEPLCPCRMRDVQIRDGRYVLPERDLGPIAEAAKDAK